ncbi:hypothetical protein AZE42_10858, partial [Rhizopogon vesiculosus]
MIVAGELLAGGLSIRFAHAGERFRRMRRALYTHLQPRAAEAYRPLQMSHAKKAVLNILDDPYNFLNHAGTYDATTIMKFPYGKDEPTSATDPDVIEARQCIERLIIAMRPGAYLVDSIPWLKYLPWYGQELKRGFESSRRLYIRQLNRVKQQIQNNTDVGPSFAKYVLENGHSYGITEIEAAFLAGPSFSWIHHAACFPEEQAKVLAELGKVIGRHRAPTFSDQQSLPHLQAFISEALRWRPLSANGRCLRGRAISRDPEVFPEPHAFKPQRWIDDQGRLRDDIKFFVYGFGR